jgi:hypothetical protein
MWEYWGMTNESEFKTADRLAGQVGRLQAEIMCMENFLNTITDRDDVPAGIKLGAEHYLKSIKAARERNDLP